jgi:hypothetical protein
MMYRWFEIGFEYWEDTVICFSEARGVRGIRRQRDGEYMGVRGK